MEPHGVTKPMHASKKLWQSNISRERFLTVVDRVIDKDRRCARAFLCCVVGFCGNYKTAA